MVDVVEFFSTTVFPDLASMEKDIHPIIKVDAIRFVYVFRNQVYTPSTSAHFNVTYANKTVNNTTTTQSIPIID